MMSFCWDKWAEKTYQLKRKTRVEKLADKMMKEFSRGGSVFLDDYNTIEIKAARKLYNEKQKHKAPDNIKSEIKGKWRINGKNH
jgi:hypothetical protein